DRGERQVAERAAPLPALVTSLGDHALGLRARVETLQRLEPLDACEAVPTLAAPLGIEEVVGERPRVLVGEADRTEPSERIVRQERTGSGLTIEPRSSASTAAAIRRNSTALSDSEPFSSSGSPASPHSRRSGSSGTLPSSGIPSSAARRSPPPEPN